MNLKTFRGNSMAQALAEVKKCDQLEQDKARVTLGHIVQLLDDVLPAIAREGRATLTIAIGCTGGRHRSVAMVEALANELGARGQHPTVRHRDLHR